LDEVHGLARDHFVNREKRNALKSKRLCHPARARQRFANGSGVLETMAEHGDATMNF